MNSRSVYQTQVSGNTYSQSTVFLTTKYSLIILRLNGQSSNSRLEGIVNHKLTLTYSFSFQFSSFLKNSTGKDTDGITFELQLSEHIPEWLPIQGQKIRIFYYGMQRQCNQCWDLGHAKWQCQGKKLNWRGYVDGMIDSGRFAPAMYGKWAKKPDAPAANVQDVDLRAVLDDPEKMKKMFEFFNVMQGKSGQTQHQGQRKFQANRGRGGRGGNHGGRGRFTKTTDRDGQNPNPNASQKKKPDTKKNNQSNFSNKSGQDKKKK